MATIASQITSFTIVYSTVFFRRRSKEISKLRVTGLCVENSPETGEFPAQMASNAENVSIWWRHHGVYFWVSSVALSVVRLPGRTMGSPHKIASNGERKYFYANTSWCFHYAYLFHSNIQVGLAVIEEKFDFFDSKMDDVLASIARQPPNWPPGEHTVQWRHHVLGCIINFSARRRLALPVECWMWHLAGENGCIIPRTRIHVIMVINYILTSVFHDTAPPKMYMFRW